MLVALLRIVLILGVSAGLGAAYVAVRPAVGLSAMPWTPDVAKVRDTLSRKERIRQKAGISLEEFLEQVELGAVIIDARSEHDFEQGHVDAPNSVVLNIFGEEAESSPLALEKLNAVMYTGLPVVMYCNSITCDLAEDVYIAMERSVQMDTSMVRIFFGGWDLLKDHVAHASGPDTWQPGMPLLPMSMQDPADVGYGDDSMMPSDGMPGDEMSGDNLSGDEFADPDAAGDPGADPAASDDE